MSIVRQPIELFGHVVNREAIEAGGLGAPVGSHCADAGQVFQSRLDGAYVLSPSLVESVQLLQLHRSDPDSERMGAELNPQAKWLEMLVSVGD